MRRRYGRDEGAAAMGWISGEASERVRAFAPSADAGNVVYLQEFAELRARRQKQHEGAAERVTDNIERDVQARYARPAIHLASSVSNRRVSFRKRAMSAAAPLAVPPRSSTGCSYTLQRG